MSGLTGNGRKAGRSKKTAEASGGPALVLTVGHSTRPIEEFVRLLRAHEVTGVVDVRSIPQSRYNPQFEQGALAKSLREAGLDYVHMPGLGGLRHAKKDSLNLGWRNASFRGYADYMGTEEFAKSLEELMELARRKRVAVMCAEAVPWRCHRSLIGDALVARGFRVEDILSETRRPEHQMTGFARVRGKRITYPGEKERGPAIEGMG